MPVTFTASPHTLYKLPLTRQQLIALLNCMVAHLNHPEATVEFLLVDDATMQTINAETFGFLGPTNILSFPQSASPVGQNPSASHTHLFGSLVLSVDTLLRECFLYQQPPVEHTIRLLAHGMAHLAGYDHSLAMDNLCSQLEKIAITTYNSL